MIPEFLKQEQADRVAWRAIVATIGDKAKAKLPECNGRVESAITLVLMGDVKLLGDGSAMVGSQSKADLYYRVNGECPCKDYPQAPRGFCKHRLSALILLRATQVYEASQPQAKPEHWCVEHRCELQRQTKDNMVWYSHQLTNGKWCKGKIK